MAKGSGTTLSVSPQAVGDLIVLTVATNNSTPPTVSSVSGGGVSTWTLDKRLTDTNSSGYDAEIWSGVVTSAGASTISINVSGYSNGNDLTAQELSAGPGTTWTITSAGSVASDGTPWDYPSLTASGPGQLYYGFAVTNNNSWNTLSGGGTPGFTFTSTGLGGGTLIAYDASVSGTVQPTGTDNGASYQDAVGIMVAATSGGPTASTPLLWAGQYYDSTTGLYYMRARWYDPSTGEFLSVDPDFTQTLDAYGYADDSPIDATDPSGLMFVRVSEGSQGTDKPHRKATRGNVETLKPRSSQSQLRSSPSVKTSTSASLPPSPPTCVAPPPVQVASKSNSVSIPGVGTITVTATATVQPQNEGSDTSPFRVTKITGKGVEVECGNNDFGFLHMSIGEDIKDVSFAPNELSPSIGTDGWSQDLPSVSQNIGGNKVTVGVSVSFRPDTPKLMPLWEVTLLAMAVPAVAVAAVTAPELGPVVAAAAGAAIAIKGAEVAAAAGG